jgi:hypothetical protein
MAITQREQMSTWKMWKPVLVEKLQVEKIAIPTTIKI